MPMIQVGLNRFMDDEYARKEGVPRYAPRAAVPKRPVVVRAAAASTLPRKVPAMTPPRDISDALLAGLSNDEINGLVASGTLRRPSVGRCIQFWSTAVWRQARQRGLIW